MLQSFGHEAAKNFQLQDCHLGQDAALQGCHLLGLLRIHL